MNNDEFFGVLKLITGEEIIAKVVPYHEEDGILLEYPLEIDAELIQTSAGSAIKVDLSPWFKFSEDTIFFIEKEKVISIAEAESRILQLYRTTLRKMITTDDSNRVSLDEELGFKNHIDQARAKLEEAFKLNMESKE
jgi:hypothetical protein